MFGYSRIILTHQCSCSSLDYEPTDQSLQLIGVPSEFVTQQTSEMEKYQYKIMLGTYHFGKKYCSKMWENRGALI